MNQQETTPQSWDHVRRFLVDQVPGWFDSTPEESLTLQLDDEDWLLEMTPEGVLIIQAGYCLEDMESILSDGTAEDLGSDELAKQAKFYLQQTVSKHRPRLIRDGFSERTEMNDEYVAMLFERQLDLTDLPALADTIRQTRSQFPSALP